MWWTGIVGTVETGRCIAEIGRERVRLALAAAVTAALYACVVTFPFVHDDIPQIVNASVLASWRNFPHLFSPELWNQGWGWDTTTRVSTFYRPLFLAWLMLNRHLFGLEPWAWHLMTLALHLVTTVLVFYVARALAKDSRTATLAALVFGVHPVHVEGVAWVSGGTEPLGAIFFLAAFLSYLRARGRPWRNRWNMTALATFAAGVLCKETVVSLPVVLVAYECVYGDQPNLRSRVLSGLKATYPYFAVAAAYGAVRLLVFRALPGTHAQAPMATVMLTIPSVLWFYTRHLLFPRRLSVFYDTYYVDHVTSREFLLPLLTIAALATLLVIVARRWRSPAMVFSLVWFAVTLAPALNFRAFYWRELAHDRYVYLPSIGFCVIAASALLHISFGQKRLFGMPASRTLASIVVIAALAVSTSFQLLPWSSALLLYTNAVKVAPMNVGANFLLASELQERAQYDDALRLYDRSTRLAPNWEDAYLAAGKLCYYTARLRAADRYLSRASAIKPDDSIPYYFLGVVRLRARDGKGAIEPLRRAVELDPKGPGYHFALATALQKAGRIDEAREEFKKQIALDGMNEDARRKLQELERN
jgi:tetratricopeptide (TPR) repeat protein